MTVCDKFKPTILEGQLCYTLDIALLVEKPTKHGRNNGLFLLLDPNPYQLHKSEKNVRGPKSQEQFFKVFIHTLGQYSAYGSGSYGMSSLKKMTGTKSFEQLPVKQKNCLVHNREECQTQKYLDQVSRECKCTPWALGTGQEENQVKINPIISFLCMFQVLGMCGPEKECCVGNQTLRDNSCLVPCAGLYAYISDDSGTKLRIFNHNTCIRSPNADTKAEPSVAWATS